MNEKFSHNSNELKARIDLRDIVGYFWGQPTRSKNNYDVYASHWRDDGRSASFNVHATYFKDFGGEGLGGDVYTFLQHELNIDFKAAVEWLANYVGDYPPSPYTGRGLGGGVSLSPLRPQGEGGRGMRAMVEPPPAAWQAAARKVLRQTQNYLWSQHPAAGKVRAYLRDVRGLSDDTIRAAGYGYNPKWQKVTFDGEAAYLAPGIIEPWECDGVLWALRVRCRVGNLAEALNMRSERGRDDGELPKYLNLAGSKQNGALYNGDAITPHKLVLLVEGGFDAQLAQQVLGEGVAVVTFGSASSRPTQQRIDQIKTAAGIFLLLDADAAGQVAQNKLLAALGDEAVALKLPVGKDVTDFVVEHGGSLAALLVKPKGWWRGGLPDTYRSAFLNHFRPMTAPVIEMLNLAADRGLLDSDGFTIEDALRANAALGLNISESSLRRVIHELIGYLFSKLETNKKTKESVSISENSDPRVQVFRFVRLEGVKKALLAWAVPRLIERHYGVKRNRDNVIVGGIIANPTPAMLVALGFSPEDAAEIAPKITELAKSVLNGQEKERRKARKALQYDYQQLVASLEVTESTPLPENWPLGTAGGYRAAFFRATNDPEKRRSRSEIGKQVGIANGSIKGLVHQAGLEKAVPEGEFVIKPLEAPEFLESQVQKAARAVKGYPRSLVVNHADGRSQELFYSGGDMQPEINAFVEQGAEVAVRLQLANRFVEVTDTPPKPEIRPVQAKKPAPPRSQPQNQPRHAFYGPGHDPQWVTEQLTLIFLRLNRLEYRGSRLLDTRTGEIVNDADGGYLLRILLL